MVRCRTHRSVGLSRVVVVVGLSAACSVHDASLLDPPESKSRSGITMMDGSSGTDAPDDAPPEPQLTNECGDGKISAAEKCDTGITAGMPGACPTSCPQEVACAPRTLSGSGCQAECMVVPVSCTSGDECCPPDCTSAIDSDCSASCGNGQVDPDQGETCEPDTETPCPSPDDCDDGMACTDDVFMGSEGNCNAECVSMEITQAANGDGCCPDSPDVHANNDDDCEPECGNGVREGDEECDGGMGCDDSCVLTLTPEQMDCMERLVVPDSPDEACQVCSCTSCTQEVFDCRDDSNETRRGLCEDLITCALANDCTGNPCYCGTDALCLAPNGPCIPETQAAAETTDPFVLLDRNTNPEFAVGRANLLGTCAVNNCSDVCP